MSFTALMPFTAFFPLDGDFPAADATVFGGKGYGLYQMNKAGLPVPPAMVIPAHICQMYRDDPAKIMHDIRNQLPDLKEYLTAKFGYMPLVSVRSGARVSMPGMMDTILNVGLDKDTFPDWEGRLGSDCVHACDDRLIEQFGTIVKGLPKMLFEQGQDPLNVYQANAGTFPDADDQIIDAIEAVFKSWDNDRAKHYRKMHNIPDEWGTAVVVQAMVFGNFNDNSATGVLFTRNPDTGEKKLTGEFLVKAQGEDVVDGSHTPRPFDQLQNYHSDVHHRLAYIAGQLEASAKDVQDIEWTMQDGKLYILQTRNAKRSSRAAIKIAVDMVKEKLWSAKDLKTKVSRNDFLQAFAPIIDPTFDHVPDWEGIPACSGIAVGKIVKSAQAAIDCQEPCVLVTNETTPDDIAGMEAAVGVLTMTGGATSHAAVVARSMNKPCVVGLSQNIDDFPEGETISLDGSMGYVWGEAVPVIPGGEDDPTLAEFIQLLAKGQGVKLIGRRLTPMIDVSDMTPEAAAHAVALTVEKTKAQVIVDITQVDRDADLLTFLDVSPGNREVELAQGIAKLVSPELLEDTLFMSSVSLDLLHLNRLPRANHVEELLEVYPGDTFVYQGEVNEKAKRVLNWLAQDGCTSAVVGSVTKGGFASAFQLVEKLLT